MRKCEQKKKTTRLGLKKINLTMQFAMWVVGREEEKSEKNVKKKERKQREEFVPPGLAL